MHDGSIVARKGVVGTRCGAASEQGVSKTSALFRKRTLGLDSGIGGSTLGVVLRQIRQGQNLARLVPLLN